MSASTRDCLTLLVVVSLPLLVWWVGLYPGTFTNDSLSVIRQIRTESWTTATPTHMSLSSGFSASGDLHGDWFP
jgi:hypothetical protein